MTNISFLHPDFFWLLLLLPLVMVWYFYKRNEEKPTLTISSLQGFKTTKSALPKWRPVLFGLRLLCLTFLIVALARPRAMNKVSEGIDIVITSDVSTSMLSKDFSPNRLEAMKMVATEFVKDRVNDRIGVVVYAGESYTKSPITNNKEILNEAINSINCSLLVKDGTAIGLGLATSINRLKESTAKSKVIILMTDGENNAGFIEPILAADIAAQYGIRIYTIGIGSKGLAESFYGFSPIGEPIFRVMPVNIDENLLRNIAATTKGKYFRAQDITSLQTIYSEINKLEKTKKEEIYVVNYTEKFRLFALLALFFLVLEIALRNTIFKSFI